MVLELPGGSEDGVLVGQGEMVVGEDKWEANLDRRVQREKAESPFTERVRVSAVWKKMEGYPHRMK